MPLCDTCNKGSTPHLAAHRKVKSIKCHTQRNAQLRCFTNIHMCSEMQLCVERSMYSSVQVQRFRHLHDLARSADFSFADVYSSHSLLCVRSMCSDCRCNDCGIFTTSPDLLTGHLRGRKHHKRLAAAASGSVPPAGVLPAGVLHVADTLAASSSGRCAGPEVTRDQHFLQPVRSARRSLQSGKAGKRAARQRQGALHVKQAVSYSPPDGRHAVQHAVAVMEWLSSRL